MRSESEELDPVDFNTAIGTAIGTAAGTGSHEAPHAPQTEAKDEDANGAQLGSMSLGSMLASSAQRNRPFTIQIAPKLASLSEAEGFKA